MTLRDSIVFFFFLIKRILREKYYTRSIITESLRRHRTDGFDGLSRRTFRFMKYNTFIFFLSQESHRIAVVDDNPTGDGIWNPISVLWKLGEERLFFSNPPCKNSRRKHKFKCFISGYSVKYTDGKNPRFSLPCLRAKTVNFTGKLNRYAPGTPE